MNGQLVFCEVCGMSVEVSKYEFHKKYGHVESSSNKSYSNKCDVCGKTFSNSYNLQYHMAHHINAREFVCNACPKAFNTASDLTQHQRIHEKGSTTFYCPECDEGFDTRRKMNHHRQTHHSDQPPASRQAKKCPICEKMVKDLLRHHQGVHLNLRNHGCDFCDKKFTKKSALDRHVMTVHRKLKNFECELCEKAYGEKADLKKHIERIHFCEICEDQFGDLEQHNEELHDEKADSKKQEQHFCTMCKKHFKNLKRHERFHFCEICVDHFEDLQQHNQEKHVSLVQYCDTCFEVFESLQDLESHMKTKHSTIFSFFCDYCEKGFVEKLQIQRHMDAHKISRVSN